MCLACMPGCWLPGTSLSMSDGCVMHILFTSLQVEVVREALGKVEVNIVQNLVDPYCVALGTKEVVSME